MKKTLSVLALGLMTTWSQASYADARIDLNDSVAVEDQTEFRLEVPVGSIELQHHSRNSIEVEVRVEESDGWFSSRDLDSVEISKRVSGSRISMRVDEDDTEQHWVVYVPEGMDLDISMGVGSVDLDDVSASLNLDIGVGDGDVSLANDDYAEISLETGVGGATLRGFDNQRRDRSIVSEEVTWRGGGKHSLEAEVGVGDIKVKG